MGRCLILLIVRGFPLIGLVAALALVMLPALGRDVDGRYKDAPLHEWFNHRRARKASAVHSLTATLLKTPIGCLRTVTIGCACRRPPAPKT